MTKGKRRREFFLTIILILVCICVSACSYGNEGSITSLSGQQAADAADTSRYLVVVDDEPDTVDFQCTSIYYVVALNVFDRLVEMQTTQDGDVKAVPALAKSWEVSGDGLVYTFHLRRGVTFSNGSELTASDVQYTFTRLLTHPDSCNQDLVMEIEGAARLADGETDRLEGFKVLSDTDFTITLAQPFEAFLACLSMSGASILDQETTEAAGDRFGIDPACTIGTGPFVLDSWEAGKGMLLSANPTCWEGLPGCAGINMRFIRDGEEERQLFENGKMDILDLDELGMSAEYFMNGNAYRNQLCEARQICITYIALNESVKPLNDVRVRRAMQLALDRQMLLDAIYSGRGEVENGIFPVGLKGHNPDLPGIPFDPDGAAALLAEAGCPEGFDLVVSVRSSAKQQEKKLMQMAAAMWEKIGIRAHVEVIDESLFMSQRKAGTLACYAATWDADYNDPDNFIYTFFGSRANTTFRSLCYPDEAVMDRVRRARSITDDQARIEEYQELERVIVQEDAAWIPLFSKLHYYVRSKRVHPFQPSWNGWVSTRYRYIVIDKQQ